MKRLNIFINESGSISPVNGNIDKDCILSDRFYILTLVFALDNDDRVYETFLKMDELKNKFGFSEKIIHYGPLIRRENEFFKQFNDEEVRNIFFATANIISKSPINSTVFVLDKKQVSNKKEIERYFIDTFSNLYYSTSIFNKIDDIKVYYDSGQECVSNFIVNGIYKCFPKHEETPFNAKPKDYDFLQIADFICTMKLIDIKRKSSKSSICEKRIFNDTKKYKTKIIDKLRKVLN